MSEHLSFEGLAAARPADRLYGDAMAPLPAFQPWRVTPGRWRS